MSVKTKISNDKIEKAMKIMKKRKNVINSFFDECKSKCKNHINTTKEGFRGLMNPDGFVLCKVCIDYRFIDAKDNFPINTDKELICYWCYKYLEDDEEYE